MGPADLFGFLASPEADAMNFLNEVAARFPDAISFAAGRPYDGYFASDLVHQHVDTYLAHLRREHGGDERAVRRDLLQYGRTKGIIGDLIADSLAVDEGIAVDPESVVVTVGAQEALFLVLRALRSGPADVALHLSPAYSGFTGAARLAGMPTIAVPGGPDGLGADAVRAALRGARADGLRPRLLYLNPDYANPTGTSLTRAARHAALALAEDEDILLLEDNPYRVFGGAGEPEPTLKALDTGRRVVHVGSFAKTVFPGARVGFVVADQPVALGGRTGPLADELAKLKSLLTVNTSPIAQAVVAGKLLENGLSIRAANKREIEVYQRNLRLVRDGLAAAFPPGEWPGVRWNDPGGGFFLLLDVPFVADDAALERSGRAHGVLWTPVHHFHGDGRPRRRMRLSISHLDPDEITEGLARLTRFVKESSPA